MKRLISLTFLLFAFITPVQASTVARVVDGDTVKVVFHGSVRTVRLSCVDAPEKNQPFGAESAAILRNKITGQTIRIHVLTKDRYGRSVSTLTLNERNIPLELVREGAAWAYRAYCKDPKYIEAENYARTAKLGLWAGNNPIYPPLWRKGIR